MAPERRSTLLANLAQYQLFLNSYRGGRYVRTPPTDTLDPATRSMQALEYGTYLKRLPNESEASFDLRVARAAYRNYCQEIVRVYVSTLFAAGMAIEREAVISGLGAVATDLDLRGTGVHGFVRAAFCRALIYGWVGCLTDYPKSDPAIRTVADEAAAGRRPYSRLITPDQLWDWERDPVTLDWSRLLISEGWHPWYGTEVWLELLPGGWYVVDDKGERLDAGETTFERIPFDVLVCDDPAGGEDEPFGHSALRDVADLQMELYQLSSLDEDLLRKANFPFLHKKAQPETVQKVEAPVPLGADYGIVTEAELAWVQPDSGATETNRAKLAELERQIRQIAGIATRSEESTEAHSGAALAWEYSTRLALVKLRAENLRDWEVRLWRTYESILGVDLGAESVRYPSDYATAPVPEEIADLQQLHDLGAPIEVQRAFLRSIVLKQFAHRPDLAALLAAVERWEEPAPVVQIAPQAPPESAADAEEAA